MDFPYEEKFSSRNNTFKSPFTNSNLIDKRTKDQVELRTQKRSDRASQQRPLKKYTIEWILQDEIPDQPCNISNLNDYIDQIQSLDKKQNLSGIKAIRKILSNLDTPITKIIKAGVLPLIIPKLYYDDCPQIQYECAWAITNMCIGKKKNIEALINAGCLQGLSYLLSSEIDELKEQAIWAIGNLASDSLVYRDAVLESGVLEKIIRITMDAMKLSTIRQGCWTLSTIFRISPVPIRYVSDFMPVIGKCIMMYKELNELIVEVLWATSKITEQKNLVYEFLQLGVLKEVCILAMSKAYNVVVPALIVLGNIIGGTDYEAGQVIKAGGLRVLKHCINVDYTPVRQETIWALSNLCAGDYQQVNSIMKSGILKDLIILTPKLPSDLQNEVSWVFGNIVSNESSIIEALVEQGLFETIGILLKSNSSKCILVTLMALEKVLEYSQYMDDMNEKYMRIIEETGISNSLYELQMHKNEKVYKKVHEILQMFFEYEDECQELLDKISQISTKLYI